MILEKAATPQMVNRVKQALNLTLFLVSVEFFLIFLILLTAEFVFVLFGGTDRIGRMTLDTLHYPLLLIFFRIMWAGYPTTAILIFLLVRWTDAGRCSLIRLTMASLAGYAVFCAFFFASFDHSGLVAMLQPSRPIPTLQTVGYITTVGIASVIAPVLISRLSAKTIDNWLSRIGRALALVIVLIFMDYVVLVAVSIGLEYASTFFPEGPRGSLIGEDGWAAAIMTLSAIVITTGIRFQNYTIAALLIIALNFTATRSRRAGFVKLLIASFGSYVLSAVLVNLESAKLGSNVLFFEFITPWMANFLYTIGITVILAPIAVYCLARRVKWLSGLLHGS